MSAPMSWAWRVEFNGVLGTEGNGAHLEEGGGLDPACLVHGHLGQRLSLLHREGPPFGKSAGEPEPVVVEIAEAVAHQRPIGIEVEVVAVSTARRV